MHIFKTLSIALPLMVSITGAANASEWPPGGVGGGCCPFSDAQLKSHIHPLENSTQKLLQLQGVSFEWRDRGTKDIGLVAQDVQKVYPQIVHQDKERKYLRVDYEKLVAPLVESIRELDARVKILEAQQAAK